MKDSTNNRLLNQRTTRWNDGSLNSFVFTLTIGARVTLTFDERWVWTRDGTTMDGTETHCWSGVHWNTIGFSRSYRTFWVAKDTSATCGCLREWKACSLKHPRGFQRSFNGSPHVSHFRGAVPENSQVHLARRTNLRVRIVMVGAKTCFHSGTCCLSTPTFMVLFILTFSNISNTTKISLRRCFVNDQEVIIFSCTSGTPLIGDPN